MRPLEAIKFFVKYICAPRRTGAVCPSSRFLSRKMAQGVDIGATEAHSENKVVVELGAGTGAVTQALVDSGYADILRSIEFDSSLFDILSDRFPNVKVMRANAEHLREVLGLESERVCAVVSSLPLVSLPKDCVENIVSEIEAVLPKGGHYVQYTYKIIGKNKNVRFKSLRKVSSNIVLLNIPPARVDVYEKI